VARGRNTQAHLLLSTVRSPSCIDACGRVVELEVLQRCPMGKSSSMCCARV
jgi:hypothetical protein